MKLLGRFFVVGLLLVLFATTLSAASAADSATHLSIRPIGVEGSYFTLTMSPGETRQLTVELGNFGDAPVETRTYAADAYSIVNGGFGARLDGEPTGDVTKWLSYTPETLTIAPAARQERTFALTIPHDTKPGEYITSVVIQNATPTSTSQSGSVGIKQINRQVIAVAITVPGPLAPGLQIGTATYKPVGERSVISFGVTNTGNVHLKPAGEFVITTKDGAEVSRGTVTMDSVYAGTQTAVEALLAQRLNPGDYVASLTLTDAKTGATASAASLAVTVPQEVASSNGNTSSAPSGAAVNQPASEQSQVGMTTGTRSILLPLLIVVGLAVVLLLIGFSLILARRRRFDRVRIVTAPPVQSPSSPALTIRQIPIRGRRPDNG